MNPIRISIVTIGSLKHPLNADVLAGWRSGLMALSRGAPIAHLSNAEGDDWQYTDEQLSCGVQASPTADITLALINAPLEDNYYLRRLGGNVAVLSLHEMVEIVREDGYTVEALVLRIA